MKKTMQRAVAVSAAFAMAAIAAPSGEANGWSVHEPVLQEEAALEAGDQAGKAEKTRPGDQQKMAKILSRMHQSNQFEIQVGQLAAQKGESVEVRRFGERLVRDHRQGDEMVRGFASERDIELKPLPTNSKNQKLLSKLQKLNGKKFDQAFLKGMEQGHKKVIQTLSSAKQQMPQDSDLAELISKLVPILGQHHHVAVDLQKEQEA